MIYQIDHSFNKMIISVSMCVEILFVAPAFCHVVSQLSQP